ncbi:2-succinyl-5-enolpyruvyl-6-hydroxy-3-cyclohexene-1-carboxylic-acid synthase [Fulvivirgaceae bacterium BMA12]|uniref:2-succinyl-5-enolpyruvyl-6-hydroxy-3-cyclohexene-1-carboxylate synthase n=1 Tax=Agaribacillus aureus TaxID=3051825 RepID=A0ABT8L8Q4_9BACT|nr:2-succinyl-5-enolpyruvyl-6-hydroxy-3-cyclohexene-1-carboxylic-acid synthase [Fulvivirgaceae bacterium BMA12]
MILQPLVDIAEICARKKVSEVILSPGSRCAPLTLAFSRHPAIRVRTISDERSAAFIGVGMAQMSGAPVALVCTSGSAALNYAPAVAEAFFLQVPLLLLTADRPPEWIDQQDGQTIRQSHVYGKHVKKSFDLPVDYSHPDASWQINRIINEAINLSRCDPPGPVHINVPIREPFYPEEHESINYSRDVRIIDQHFPPNLITKPLKKTLFQKFRSYQKILIVAGQGKYDAAFVDMLRSFAVAWHIPVVADIISNCQLPDIGIKHQDAFLGIDNEELLSKLAPNLLISFGKSVISKQLKLFLRKYRAVEHWHIQPGGEVADTFQSLTDIFQLTPSVFFKTLQTVTQPELEEQHTFLNEWKAIDRMVEQSCSRQFSDGDFSEFSATKTVLEALPADSILHLANSMPVRYANYLGIQDQTIAVFANRGTSGIDGSVSTAIGCALSTDKLVTLITGDMAFFYDRNAFWNHYLPANLRVIILNNHGGGIFGLIKGPDRQPELEERFETYQPLRAENLCKEFDIEYARCQDFPSLREKISGFFNMENGAKILEIETEKAINKKFFTNFKHTINNIYGN